MSILYYKFTEKEDRLIAKRYLGDSFLKSYIVPTCMFPLHDDYTNCDRATGHSKLTMMFEENGLITKR